MYRAIFSTFILALVTVSSGQSPDRKLTLEQTAAFNQATGQITPLPPGTTTQVGALPAKLQRKLEILGELRSAVDPTDRRDPRDIVQAHARTKAHGKLTGNDLAGAEEFLTATSPFEAESIDWHFDAAHRWLDLAHELSLDREGRKSIPAAAGESLRHLNQAAAKGRERGSIPAQLAANRTAAYVHERFRGDPAAAIASYRAALALQPDDEGAREGLNRLEKSLANLQARVRSGNR